MLACVESMRENDLLGARAERCLAPALHHHHRKQQHDKSSRHRQQLSITIIVTVFTSILALVLVTITITILITILIPTLVNIIINNVTFFFIVVVSILPLIGCPFIPSLECSGNPALLMRLVGVESPGRAERDLASSRRAARARSLWCRPTRPASAS